MPEIKSQLLSYADWQESDIHLAFCKTFVSSCEQGINTFDDSLILDVRRWNFDIFMLHAAQYELYSGKPCAELIYKLDEVFRSRPPAMETPGLHHWVHSFLPPCKPDWAIPEAHALLFCAAIYGLRLFVQQKIGTLSHVACTILNELLQALLLGRYHLHLRLRPLPVADAVGLLCCMGANPNANVRTTISSTADQKTLTLTWTIWELYLHDTLPDPHHEEPFVPFGTFVVMETLIECGADLECRLPAGCTDMQQAIERRLEATCPAGLSRRMCKKFLKRIKAALLKRGYTWVEPSQAT